MKLLDGKYALITGGGRGIGRAIAIDFARNGANVAVVSRTKSELEHVVDLIEQKGVKGLAISADLSTLQGVQKSFNEYFDNFNRCDILVNNAGMTQYSTVSDFPIEYAQKLFNINIMAPYAMSKLILPKMMENRAGKIMMTSSVQGNIYFASKKVAYGASKAAITAMGLSLHAEVSSQGISVFVILPGSIQTKMMEDLIEMGQKSGPTVSPEIISPIYLFLASDMAKRKYQGKAFNQQAINELYTIVKDLMKEDDCDIKETMNLIKEKLNKSQLSLLRQNQELIEFMLQYIK